MIELRNITKTYPVKNGRRYVLKDVSLVIPDGTNIAVLGPNGAGKSTLLKLLGGAEFADRGEIICDKEMSWPLGMGTGFQGSLTGRQNLEFVCNINGLQRSQRRRVAEYVYEFAELGEYFDMPVNTYSSGMRSRLSFGLSMAFKFEVYLIDELTAVGDRGFKQKAKDAFRGLRNRAQLIYVSHSMETLKDACESALFVHDGQLDYFADIEEGIEVYKEYADNRRKQSKNAKTSRKKKKRG